MARSSCSIAHDLSGVITIIRGSADLARDKLEPDNPAASDLERIARACERAAALAMELRALGCTTSPSATIAETTRA